MPDNLIRVTIDSNEQGTERAKLLIAAIRKDKRFAFGGYVELEGIDVLFEYDDQLFGVELKIAIDFVASILNGHLYEQVLTARELMLTSIILVLDDLEGIYKATKKAADGRHLRGDDLSHAIASNHMRCKSFRKRAFLNGVPTFWKGNDSGFFDTEDQYHDLLELVIDYFTDGQMIGFAKKPADDERQIVCLCTAKGIGEKTGKALIKEYGSPANLCRASLPELAAFQIDGRKIGQSKAESLMRLLHGEIPGKHDIHIGEKK